MRKLVTLGLLVATVAFAGTAFAEVNDERFRAGLPEAFMVAGQAQASADAMTKTIAELRARLDRLESALATNAKVPSPTQAVR